ncbi:MAG: right-handed parallel beta-helix repeat-containing protein [Armatimonadetes bacterium]|nr:right-handed parallel beta-helix repeat-containing protein [Armatimonadota bacterium]
MHSPTNLSRKFRVRAAWLIMAVIGLASVVSPSLGAEREVSADFYVATNGSDDWSGSLPAPNAGRTDGPFATLDRARNAVRERKQAQGELTKEVTVMVRGGKYFLGDPLVLEEQDSGTKEHSITWSAYPDEKPIISGGRKITGWKPYKGKILSVDLPEAGNGKWKFRQLFLNGERLIRARTPNYDPQNPLYGGWELMVGSAGPDAFKCKPGVLDVRLSKPTQAEVFFFTGTFGSWGSRLYQISSIDYQENKISLLNYTAGERPLTGFSLDCRFRIENAIEYLDQPGEWYLDWDLGRVYLWPPEDSGKNLEVVAPVLDEVLIVDGAKWIRISGFTFTETKAYTNKRRSGSALLRNAEHCRFENNRIYAVGDIGLMLSGQSGRECTWNLIQRNDVGFAGSTGIYFDGRANNNQVLDNEVHNCGFYNKYAAGIEFPFYGRANAEVAEGAHADGNLIAHNYVHDVPRDGIMLGAVPWGRNIVEYNEVRRTCLETTDAAGIRCHMDGFAGVAKNLSAIPDMVGHVVRYNLVVDSLGCGAQGGKIVVPSFAFGTYFDDLSANCLLVGNIVVHSHVGFWVNAGRNHTIENNIFVDCDSPICFSVPPHLHDDRVYDYVTDNRVLRNIFYSAGAKTTSFPIRFHSDFGKFKSEEEKRHTVKESDYNVIFATDGNYPGIADWQAVGYESHSIKGDPLFVDPKRKDYQIKPDSPARKLGFVPIDISKIGIRQKG